MPGMEKGVKSETLAHLKRQHLSLDSVLPSSGQVTSATNVSGLPSITPDFAGAKGFQLRCKSSPSLFSIVL